MKRWPVALALAALALSLTFVSCDAMFEKNFFQDMTHEELDTASIQAKTPEEIQALTESDVYMEQLTADETLKDAALSTLATSYTVMTPGDPAGEVAAVTAVKILIKTDPNAAALSASVVAAIDDLGSISDSTTAEADVADVITGILPAEIAASVAPGAAMPPAFADLVNTFISINSVTTTLGTNLVGVDDGTGTLVYSYTAEVTSGDALSLAIDGLISAFFMAVTPADTTVENPVAAALWKALCDPANAASYLTFDTTALDNADYLANLLSAAGIAITY